jgi:ribonuclease HI
MECATGACPSAGSPSKSGHVQSTVVSQTAGIVVSLSDLRYDIWTDGACANKTSGAGGYAAVLFARRSDGIAERWEVSGGAFKTTNNQMELMAVITGLRALPARAHVRVHIDSTYVMKNFKATAGERRTGSR